MVFLREERKERQETEGKGAGFWTVFAVIALLVIAFFLALNYLGVPKKQVSPPAPGAGELAPVGVTIVEESRNWLVNGSEIVVEQKTSFDKGVATDSIAFRNKGAPLAGLVVLFFIPKEVASSSHEVSFTPSLEVISEDPTWALVKTEQFSEEDYIGVKATYECVDCTSTKLITVPICGMMVFGITAKAPSGVKKQEARISEEDICPRLGLDWRKRAEGLANQLTEWTSSYDFKHVKQCLDICGGCLTGPDFSKKVFEVGECIKHFATQEKQEERAKQLLSVSYNTPGIFSSKVSITLFKKFFVCLDKQKSLERCPIEKLTLGERWILLTKLLDACSWPRAPRAQQHADEISRILSKAVAADATTTQVQKEYENRLVEIGRFCGLSDEKIAELTGVKTGGLAELIEKTHSPVSLSYNIFLLGAVYDVDLLGLLEKPGTPRLEKLPEEPLIKFEGPLAQYCSTKRMGEKNELLRIKCVLLKESQEGSFPSNAKGELQVVFKSYVKENHRFPLTLYFNEKIRPLAAIVTPRQLFFQQKNTAKIVLLVDNYPYPIRVLYKPPEARIKQYNIQPGAALAVYAKKKDLPMDFYLAYGPQEISLSQVKPVSAPSAVSCPIKEGAPNECWSQTIYSLSQMPVQSKAWEYCVQEFCNCKAIQAALNSFKTKVSADLQLAVKQFGKAGVEAYKEVFGSTTYRAGLPLWVPKFSGSCMLQKEFAGLQLEQGKINFLVFETDIEKGGLKVTQSKISGETLSLENALTQSFLMATPEGLAPEKPPCSVYTKYQCVG